MLVKSKFEIWNIQLELPKELFRWGPVDTVDFVKSSCRSGVSWSWSRGGKDQLKLKLRRPVEVRGPTQLRPVMTMVLWTNRWGKVLQRSEEACFVVWRKSSYGFSLNNSHCRRWRMCNFEMKISEEIFIEG